MPPGRMMRPVHRTGVRRRVSVPRKCRGAAGFGVVPRARAPIRIRSPRVGLRAGMPANMRDRLPVRVPRPACDPFGNAARARQGHTLLRPPALMEGNDLKAGLFPRWRRRPRMRTRSNGPERPGPERRPALASDLLSGGYEATAGIPRLRLPTGFEAIGSLRRAAPSFSAFGRTAAGRPKGTGTAHSTFNECGRPAMVPLGKVPSMRVPALVRGGRRRVRPVRRSTGMSAPPGPRTFPGR